MKRVLVVGLVIVAACFLVSAAAIQAPLNSNWAADNGFLSPGIGKVIYNTPDRQNRVNLTYILQGAKPNTDYTVGFNIQNVGCAPLLWFGVAVTIECNSGPYGGITDTENIFIAGALTTDASGNGSFHINLLNLPSGEFKTLFWVVPCAPPWGCGFVPQAATGAWGGGLGGFQTINVP